MELVNGVANSTLAARIGKAFDRYAESAYSDGFRYHLGASVIGRSCSRELQYGFRWMVREKFDGRMLRLFQRGNREESVFVEYLRGIGCSVTDIDPETGKQVRFSLHNGHFGGSFDAEITFPESWQISTPILGEFKTSGTGAKFNEMCKNGVQSTKPEHYAQANLYTVWRKRSHFLYAMVNKNDDDLHVEIVPANPVHAETMTNKAHKIIFARELLPQINLSPASSQCAYCYAKDVCHNGKQPEMNCRSCKFAVAIEDSAYPASWGCEKFQQIIPRDFMETGCGSWEQFGK